MSLHLTLPKASDGTETYTLSEPLTLNSKASDTPLCRIAYSAAHTVANPLAEYDPWVDCAIDWDKTIEYRRYLWSLGLGVAEAMDTAQRGMGLDWPTSLELIKRSLEASKDFDNAVIASGCGTDHLDLDHVSSVDDVIRGYEEQAEAIEALGGRLIMMASRALAKVATGPEDYAKVYNHILSQVKEPVLIHWLGDMFDPALKGYWGSDDVQRAEETCLEILGNNADKIEGIKISLLDADMEIRMRRALPKGVDMYTGDDFNFAELIAGDDQGYSHALLGIFDAIAPAASAALQALTEGDKDRYFELLEPTVPLSRHIFKAPTRFYKTGVVFMAWLNGHQDHFTMVGGQESARSALHFTELFKLADKAGLLMNPELAAQRMRSFLETKGVEQWQQTSSQISAA